MKVLFATTNPAKVKNYKDKLENKGIKVLTLKDLNINLNVDEKGNTAIENAVIKAKAYGKETGMITIGMDTNLFLEKVSDEEQPGTHVRRVNGKTLSDEEMIEYYSKLANKYGGKLEATWVNGVAIYNKGEVKTYSFNKNKFYLIDKVSPIRHPGYPLDSISVIPEFNKCLTDLNEEESKLREEIIKKSNHEDVIDAICDMLKNL